MKTIKRILFYFLVFCVILFFLALFIVVPISVEAYEERELYLTKLYEAQDKPRGAATNPDTVGLDFDDALELLYYPILPKKILFLYKIFNVFVRISFYIIYPIIFAFALDYQIILITCAILEDYFGIAYSLFNVVVIQAIVWGYTLRYIFYFYKYTLILIWRILTSRASRQLYSIIVRILYAIYKVMVNIFIAFCLSIFKFTKRRRKATYEELHYYFFHLRWVLWIKRRLKKLDRRSRKRRGKRRRSKLKDVEPGYYKEKLMIFGLWVRTTIVLQYYKRLDFIEWIIATIKYYHRAFFLARMRAIDYFGSIYDEILYFLWNILKTMIAQIKKIIKWLFRIIKWLLRLK